MNISTVSHQLHFQTRVITSSVTLIIILILFLTVGYMSFTEVRFSENISYGSTGGPEFSTDIVVTQNVCEQRNINWSNALTRYNISYGVRSNEQLLELITFFRARRGKALGFRFKDW